jgi:integrase
MSKGYRLYKNSYRDRQGRTKQSAKWYVEFRDHLETVRRMPAFTSKSASEEVGRNLVKLVDYHRGTGGQTDPALSKWLSGLPAKTREHLVAIGLLSADRVAVAKPLAEHLADFEAALLAKGNTAFHAELVASRARKVLAGCGFRSSAEIQASKVMEFLHDLRAGTATKKGISAQTFNFYLQAVKQFCRWMVRDRRSAESPVAHLQGLNVKTDRRRDRRAFTVEELRRLFDATAAGPVRERLSGPERRLLYWLAVETGLRSAELRSLTRASFRLGGDTRTVTVEAAYSKHRREDTLPLRPELAEALQEFLTDKLPATQAFRIPVDRKKAARMFRRDVEAAGLAYRDEDGLVADFHALRHTFISNLARGGVHPKVAQSLARHSTITLTMDRYSHTLVGEQAEALGVLPDLSRPAAQEAGATGTDNLPVNSDSWALCWAQTQALQGAQGDSGRLEAGEAIESQLPGKSTISADSSGPGSVCTSGGGPGLQNQWGRSQCQ